MPVNHAKEILKSVHNFTNVCLSFYITPCAKPQDKKTKKLDKT